MARVLVLLALLAGAAHAAPLDPSTFEAMATGHTLRFTRDGQPFGAEQYFSGRRSLWRYVDGTCAEGVWWPEGENVCFSYGAEAGRECWAFESGPTGVSVRLVEGSGGEPGLTLDLAGTDTTPLDCPGPDVGT